MKDINNYFLNYMQKSKTFLIIIAVLLVSIIGVSVYMTLFYEVTPDDLLVKNDGTVSVDEDSDTIEIMDATGSMIIPKYDIPVNTYGQDNFTIENGFMTYTGEHYIGIDVAEHQKEIDWAKVKEAGVHFAMIRVGYRGATRGDIYEDTMFEQNIQGAIDNGIKVGIYFFSQATTNEEAEAEASNVLSKINEYDIDYPVVFDWEHVDIEDSRVDNISGEQVTEFANTFCNKIEAAGYTPMIYMNKNFAYNFLNLEELSEYPIWIAEYEDKSTFYYNYEMWQYSDSGSIDGITVPVDLNISMKDYGN